MYRVYATETQVMSHDHAPFCYVFRSILDWSFYSINSFLQIFVLYDGGRCLNSRCRIHFSSMESFTPFIRYFIFLELDGTRSQSLIGYINLHRIV